MELRNAVLALGAVPGVGPRTVEKIMDQLGHDLPDSLEEIVGAARELKIRMPEATVRGLHEAESIAIRTLEKCQREGITYLSRWDSGFPDRLRSIPAAPVQLFLLGNQSVLSEKGVAIIGSRNPTDYGKDMAYRMACTSVERGFTVISGLAEGSDTRAHVAALDSKGVTIAVLAHGFDEIYPSSNKDLARKILQANGCLLSEYPPETPVLRPYFIARDRLQSGLARGTVVVETGLKGGTMHTVKHTLAQGRPLAVLKMPDSISHDPSVQGNRKLIDDGKAHGIGNMDDLKGFLEMLEYLPL